MNRGSDLWWRDDIGGAGESSACGENEPAPRFDCRYAGSPTPPTLYLNIAGRLATQKSAPLPQPLRNVILDRRVHLLLSDAGAFRNLERVVAAFDDV